MRHLNPCTRCNGSGSEPEPLTREQITEYMAATGWAPKDRGGTAGALWHLVGAPNDIAVVHEGKPGSRELEGIIPRLALAEGRSAIAVAADIASGGVGVGCTLGEPCHRSACRACYPDSPAGVS